MKLPAADLTLPPTKQMASKALFCFRATQLWRTHAACTYTSHQGRGVAPSRCTSCQTKSQHTDMGFQQKHCQKEHDEGAELNCSTQLCTSQVLRTKRSSAAPPYFADGSSYNTLKIIPIMLSPLHPQHLKLCQLSGLLHQLVTGSGAEGAESNSLQEVRKMDVCRKFQTVLINPTTCTQILPLMDSVTSTTTPCNFPDGHQITSHST